MAQAHSVDVLADFAHQMRQPLSALEALTSYLDLITPQDARIQEQLRRMHAEIAHADQILSDGVRAARAYLVSAAGPVPARGASPEDVVEELSRPRTSAAMASVTH